MDDRQETFHLLNGIRQQDRLEVVAVFQPRADAGSDGIDILQDGRILDAVDVVADGSLDVECVQLLGKQLRFLFVPTADGEIRQTFECHLLGMTRTGHDGDVFHRYVEHSVEIGGDDHVLVGHDAFDGNDHELVGELGLQFLQLSLQVG